MSNEQKLTCNELRDKVEKRINQAKERQIFQKAFAVVEARGKHTKPSYTDSGETFYDDDWRFSVGDMTILGSHQCCGNGEVTIQIIKNGKTVFYGKGKLNHNSGYHDVFADNPGEVVRGYIPDQAWEEWLEQLAKPMIDKHDKRIMKEINELKVSFGL